MKRLKRFVRRMARKIVGIRDRINHKILEYMTNEKNKGPE